MNLGRRNVIGTPGVTIIQNFRGVTFLIKQLTTSFLHYAINQKKLRIVPGKN